MNDKALHFIAGTVIAAPVAYAFGPLAGLAAGSIAGLAKEVLDQIRYGGFDVADLVVTIAGAAVGAGIVYYAV
jgi:hypothetical protein